jgi:hypothetical protein
VIAGLGKKLSQVREQPGSPSLGIGHRQWQDKQRSVFRKITMSADSWFHIVDIVVSESNRMTPPPADDIDGQNYVERSQHGRIEGCR